MIIRRWQAVATDERAYRTHFRRRVLPELRAIPGFEGALLLRRSIAAGQVEIEVLTLWRSMSAIRRFAGNNVERAVVEEEARAVLQRFARRVRHYEVVLDSLRQPRVRRT